MISSRTISFNETAYEAWKQQQLEPDHRIITGTHRRWHEVRRNIVLPNPSPDNRTEEQIEAEEDIYLANRGVPVEPKKY